MKYSSTAVYCHQCQAIVSLAAAKYHSISLRCVGPHKASGHYELWFAMNYCSRSPMRREPLNEHHIRPFGSAQRHRSTVRWLRLQPMKAGAPSGDTTFIEWEITRAAPTGTLRVRGTAHWVPRRCVPKNFTHPEKSLRASARFLRDRARSTKTARRTAEMQASCPHPHSRSD
jgi:hypothetical protein